MFGIYYCELTMIYLKEVIDNLKNQVNMLQNKTDYVNWYKNKLIFN